MGTPLSSIAPPGPGRFHNSGRSQTMRFADGSTAVKDPGCGWKVERHAGGRMFRGGYPCKAEQHVQRLEGVVRYSQVLDKAARDFAAQYRSQAFSGAGPVPSTNGLVQFLKKVVPWAP